ncbi:polysaccharide lyase family 8 super-sandwich domain-containing protein [Solibaculum mannosilyticum]|uniref:polysaccharide lyase family 8 super-sandwich domain-containing protein n=1 Tax=Solibaculum mannosilyticum TaxID=2780922 RepID=UPI0036F26C16
MKRRWISMMTALVMMVSMVLTSLPAVAQETTPDDFDQIRTKWQHMAMGGDYDENDPRMQVLLQSINDVAQDLLDRINPDPTPDWGDNDYLWTEYMLGKRKSAYDDSNNVQFSYRNLRNMAIAYQTKGCDLYKNEELKNEIFRGLEYLYEYHYYPAMYGTGDHSGRYGNWFTWQVGGPIYLSEATLLMYDEMDLETVQKYATIARDGANTYSGGSGAITNPNEGANGLWHNRVLMLTAIMLKDGDMMQDVSDAVPYYIQYVKSGDGYYPDGTFAFHGNFVYNGGYGKEAFSDISHFFLLLSDSPWEIPLDKAEAFYQIVRDSYAPLMYKGIFMDMARGRELTRTDTTDAYAGITMSLSFLMTSKFAPDDVAQEFEGMIKNWMDNDFAIETMQHGAGVAWYMFPVYNLAETLRILDDDSIEKVELDQPSRQWGRGARTIHHSDDYSAALSMTSKTIRSYEQGDSNTKGWYTGWGQLYIYTNDVGQYSGLSKPTIDWERLPGVTSVATMHPSTQYNGAAFVGGATLNGLYSATGMQVQTQSPTSLEAKKSYFFFDDEVVAIGSDITSSNANTIETTFENRRIEGDNALVIDGEKMPNELGWQETLEDVNWAFMEGNVEGSDIGIYFPEGTTLNAKRETRTGKWSSLGSYNPDETEYSANWLTLWQDHGSKPENGSYEYVLLPGMTQQQVESYANNSDVEILRNDSDVHAVYKKSLNILAANMWNGGSLDAMGTSNFLTVDKPATVMVQETNKGLDISLTDSTQQADTVTLEINRAAYGVSSKDERVKVIQTSPSIILEIDTKDAIGTPIEASISYTPVDAPEATEILSTELVDDTLNLTFKNADRAEGYILQYGTESGVYTESITVTSPKASIQGLEPDTTYYFVVKAFNDSGESALSEEKSYTMGNTRRLVDNFDDMSKMASYSDGWALDQTNADTYFNGDTSRLKRNDADKTNRAEEIVYYTPDPENFEIVVYDYGREEGKNTIFEAFGSADGKTWTPIDMNREGEVKKDTWRKTVYTNAAELDSSYNYIKFVVSNNDKIWAPQLSTLTIDYAYTNDRMVMDTMLDDSKAFETTGNFAYMTTDGTDFDGDTDVAYSTDTVGTRLYSFTNIESASLTYYATGTSGAIQPYAEASVDGKTYVPVSTSFEKDASSTSEKYGKYISEFTDLPEGAKYLRVTIDRNGWEGEEDVYWTDLSLSYKHEIQPIEQVKFANGQQEAVIGYSDTPSVKVAPMNGSGELVYSSDTEAVLTFEGDTMVPVQQGNANITVNVLGTEVSDTIPARVSRNLAMNKSVTSSAVNGMYPATNAVDGNMLSRWQSADEQDAWLQIDLGSEKSIDAFDITWQQYGKQYKIQVSDNGQDWEDAFVQTSGKGGHEWIALDQPVTTRYIKMQGIETDSCYSIFEFRALSFTDSEDPDPISTNVALGKEASASSLDSSSLVASNAVDGDETTRFSTARTDDEWFVVNLGSVYTLTDINILWESAYGKEYKLQVSDDNSSWKDVVHETNGAQGWKKHSFEPVSGQYVRMLGIQRGSKYGYSFYEFQVMGYGNTDPVEINSIAFEKDQYNVLCGNKVSLGLITDPANATASSFQWESLNKDIAIVDQSGNVTALVPGEATIQVSSVLNPEVKATCKIVVEDYSGMPTPVESVTMSGKVNYMDVDEQITLSATVAPDDAMTKNVKWTSSDESILTVDNNGNVTALKPGIATIRVTSAADANIYDECTIEVREPEVPDTITAETDKDTYDVNETITMTIKTPLDVNRVALRNERGNYITLLDVHSKQEDGQKVWTVKTAVGSYGIGRVLSVMVDRGEGLVEGTTITVDIVKPAAPAAEVYSAEMQSEVANVNESFTVKVKTNLNATKLAVKNENGRNISFNVLDCVDEGDVRTYTISMSVGTAGMREFTFLAANEDGVWTETGATASIKIVSNAIIYSAEMQSESANVNEPFTVKVKTSLDATKLAVKNENGRNVSFDVLDCVDEGNVRTYTISMSVGTTGMRVFSFLAANETGKWSAMTVEASINITVKPIVYSADIQVETAKVNEPFEVKVTTNVGATKLAVKNENGRNIGFDVLGYEDEGDKRTYTISMSVGTAGMRVFSFLAANEQGQWSEMSAECSVVITK